MITINKIIIRILLIIFNVFFAPILLFSLKSKNIIVFGERLGLTYQDNSRFLFEYANKQKALKAIWITSDKKIFSFLKKKNYNVCLRDSCKALYYIVLAKYIFITVDFKDVSQLIKIRPRLKIIQLWHGTPFKKNVIDSGNEKYYLHTVASSLYLKSQITAKNKKIKKILTGYPRNDALDGIKKNKKFTIAYFPTFTKQFDFLTLPNIDEQKKLNSLKNKKNCKFFINLHPSSKEKINKKINNSLFKRLDKSSFFNTYKFLNDVDILITDISSIFFDYLLLDRPIIFLIKDKKFTKKIPVRYDFDKILPGPIVNNWNSVVKEIIKILNKKDNYKHKRNIICKKFNYYSDAKNSERIFNNLNI